MRVKLVAGPQAHQMPGLEPEAFVSDRPPKEDQGLRVEFATGMG